jgi:diguanylate cyclase (GGDEF)-like protein
MSSSVTFGALTSISAMTVLILVIAWYDFDRPRHALVWAASAAMLTLVWVLGLLTGGWSVPTHEGAVAAFAFGGIGSALNTIGFRQRAERPTWALPLLLASVLPALILLLAGERLAPVFRLVPMDVLNTALAGIAAATLDGRRRSERAAERMAFAGLLLFAAACLLMVLLRSWWTITGQPGPAQDADAAILSMLPSGVTTVGIVTIFLLTADLADQTRRLAATDVLTGLLNRRGFEESGGQMLEAAKEQGRIVSLALIDIDYFKSVNDTFGHQMGDWVISRFGELLATHAGRRDLLARLGGEEFAILMADTDIDAAYTLAEKIRAEIGRNRFGLADGRRITASFGLATFEPDQQPLASLIARADQALYRAKEGGRDCVIIYDRDIGRAAPMPALTGTAAR